MTLPRNVYSSFQFRLTLRSAISPFPFGLAMYKMQFLRGLEIGQEKQFLPEAACLPICCPGLLLAVPAQARSGYRDSPALWMPAASGPSLTLFSLALVSEPLFTEDPV